MPEGITSIVLPRRSAPRNNSALFSHRFRGSETTPCYGVRAAPIARLHARLNVERARFAGRRALVTGASRGIGAATARRLAAQGAAVAVTARTAERHPSLPGSLRATAEQIEAAGGRVVTVLADLTDAEERATIVPKAEQGLGGPVDIL